MTVRRGIVAMGLATLMTAGLAGVESGWAQERPSTDRLERQRQFRRVPPFFGQVGLTPDQREQIYSIRGDYDQRIAELARQLAELKSREMVDCEAVLTAAQQQLLVQLRAARGSRPATTPPPAAPVLDSVEVGGSSPESTGGDAKPAENQGEQKGG